MKRLTTWTIWWALLLGLWFALVGAFDRLELAAGAVAAAIGATAIEAVRSQGLLRFRIEPRWLLRSWRPFARVVPDFVVVSAALLRRRRGAFRAVPFPVRGDDAASAGRRALVSVAGSLAPNFVVVDVDAERGLVLIHELVPEQAPRKPL